MIQTASVLNRQHKKRSNPIPEKSERKDSPLNVNTTTFFWDLSLALPQMLEHSNTYWDKSNSWPTEKMVYWKYFPNNKVRKKRIFMVTAYIAFIDLQEKEVLVNDLCRSSTYHSIYKHIANKSFHRDLRMLLKPADTVSYSGNRLYLFLPPTGLARFVRCKIQDASIGHNALGLPEPRTDQYKWPSSRELTK